MTVVKNTITGGAILGTVAIFCAAIFVLVEYFKNITFANLVGALLSVPFYKLWISLALTAMSFIALGGYDVMAARIVAPTRISAWLAWLAGAMGNAISNTLGFHVVTGTVARYRVYRTVGVGLADTARIMSLSWAALGFGFLTVLGLALLLRHDGSNQLLFCGVGILSTLAILLFWLRNGPKALATSGLSLTLPSAGMAATQMGLGALEMAAAIGALYVLMPPPSVSFVMFSLAYISAVLIGIVSHAPGGIGVFEATMVSIVGRQNKAEVLAALLLYRLIYNLIPFSIAVLALGGHELFRGRSQFDGG